MIQESEVLLQPGHKWNNAVFYNHTGWGAGGGREGGGRAGAAARRALRPAPPPAPP